MVNQWFGWLWIVAGFLSGATIGLGFQNEHWLGGYGSWPRRMIRLAHVSFIMLGIINILFALSLDRLALHPALQSVASGAFILGGVAMPPCCFLSAWKRGFRHLFAVPVICLLVAGAITALGALSGGSR